MGDTFTDQAEAFNDNNENNTFDAGEFFVDINNNTMHDAVPDGLYNGPGCQHPTLCSTNTATTVRDSAVLVMSENDVISVALTFADDTGSLGGTFGSVPVDISVNDPTNRTYTILGGVNRQILPAGTTVTFNTANGRIVGPSTYTIPNTSVDERNTTAGVTPSREGIFDFPVQIATVPSDTTSNTDDFTLVVNIPGGTTYTFYSTVTD